MIAYFEPRAFLEGFVLMAPETYDRWYDENDLLYVSDSGSKLVSGLGLEQGTLVDLQSVRDGLAGNPKVAGDLGLSPETPETDLLVDLVYQGVFSYHSLMRFGDVSWDVTEAVTPGGETVKVLFLVSY